MQETAGKKVREIVGSSQNIYCTKFDAWCDETEYCGDLEDVEGES